MLIYLPSRGSQFLPADGLLLDEDVDEGAAGFPAGTDAGLSADFEVSTDLTVGRMGVELASGSDLEKLVQT